MTTLTEYLIFLKKNTSEGYLPLPFALFATDSLELKLAYTTINEHTHTLTELRWSSSQ